MTGHDMIVIGASAGGVEALKELVSLLPADLPAALFVVLHVPAHGRSALPQILSRAGALPAVHPKDGQAIQPGHIYIAPPDHHLLLKRGYVKVTRGPKENGYRPAVDPMFRSAARSYGKRVVAVVLSGALDDGTLGLIAVKMRHGMGIVQDPDDAMYAGMPLSAIENDDPNYILPVSKIAPLLVQLAHEPVPNETHPTPTIRDEIDEDVEIAEMTKTDIPSGTPSTIACPDCGGTLWELQEGELIRFRCRAGHAFTTQSLLVRQGEQLEEAFWVALRALEESASLARRMAERAHNRNQQHTAATFVEQALGADERADLVRKVLERGVLNITVDGEPDDQMREL